ncbi:hypothetical protein VitviT2T_006887 [Vitis vinifera]|uniref:Secreted protein n=1 Tax=Vitis vinifera TaxID=29760 RepID=A0ABY9BXQ9_VITVI|nr:hypothetical protein VitviT2T_006887 [Vitis vinifera]
MVHLATSAWRMTMIEAAYALMSSSLAATTSSFSNINTAPSSLSQLELEFESESEDVDDVLDPSASS